MSETALHRPASIADAVALLGADPMARPIAGGQSLLPAIRHELATPSALVDLSLIPGLDGIRIEGDRLVIGSMTTHASIARAALVRERLPGVAALAGGIADAQVRNLGTIGGSLANNDPAACWPAGVLACDATIVTDQREIRADDFFDGLFTTVLGSSELIVAIHFALDRSLRYEKFEQQASRFALIGVALSTSARDASCRVAITGSPGGVFRARSLETVLDASLAASLKGSSAASSSVLATSFDPALLPPSIFDDDLHASAAYRAHLAGVLTRRLVGNRAQGAS